MTSGHLIYLLTAHSIYYSLSRLLNCTLTQHLLDSKIYINNALISPHSIASHSNLQLSHLITSSIYHPLDQPLSFQLIQFIAFLITHSIFNIMPIKFLLSSLLTQFNTRLINHSLNQPPLNRSFNFLDTQKPTQFSTQSP